MRQEFSAKAVNGKISFEDIDRVLRMAAESIAREWDANPDELEIELRSQFVEGLQGVDPAGMERYLQKHFGAGATTTDNPKG